MRTTTLIAVLALTLSMPAEAKRKQAAPPPPPTGGLIDHINGYTVGDDGTILRFSGIVTDDDGKVVKLLTGGQEGPSNPRFRLNGGGRTVIPGLVSGWTQIVHVGLQKLLTTTREPKAIDRIRTALTNGGVGVLPRERDEAVLAAQQQLLSQGVTTAVDGGTSVEDWLSMRRAGDAGQLRMRMLSYGRGIDATLAIGGPAPTMALYGDRLRLIGMTISAGNQSPIFGDSQLRNIMSRAAMDGYQVSVSYIGEPVRQQAIAAFIELADTYKGDRRWRLERITAGPLPAADPEFETIGGLELAPSNPMPGLQSPTAAKAAFADKRVGTLQPGRFADFLILDRDVVAQPGEANVTEAWVGGARAWVRGQGTSAVSSPGVRTCGNTSGDCPPGR